MILSLAGTKTDDALCKVTANCAAAVVFYSDLGLLLAVGGIERPVCSKGFSVR